VGLFIPKDIGSEEYDEFILTEFELSEDNFFILSNSNDYDEKVRIKFPFEAKNIASPYTASVYLFDNQYISQNDVIELRISGSQNGNGRIGYIFTLASLIDAANSPFNEHSFSFAYYGFEKLVEGTTSCTPLLPKAKSEEYQLTDFYKDNLSCIVLCNENTQRETDFDFDAYLFNLYQYGFVYINDQQKKLLTNKLVLINDKFDSIKVNSTAGNLSLKIKKTILDLNNESYLGVLIKSLVEEDNHYLTRFHTFYQIIEILIDDVLKNEIKIQIRNISIEMPGFKLKEKVSKIATDGYRINQLLTKYCSINNEFGKSFSEKLKTFFSLIAISTSVEENDENENDNLIELASLIYKLRNNLVHNYRAFFKFSSGENDLQSLLMEILEYFQYLVCEIILTFKIPVVTPPSS